MAKKGENIYRRKDGRWEGRYIKGRRADGKPHYGYVYGRKYSEVRQKLLPLRCRCADGVEAWFSGTLTEWSRFYLEEIAGPKIKPSTCAHYNTLLHRHILPALGGYRLASITRVQVQAFVDDLGKTGLAVNTQRGIATMLARVMGAAVKKNLLPASPCDGVELPTRTASPVRSLSRSEQRRLETAAMADRDGLAVLLALYTGMRIGEICALRWEDVDLDTGTLRVCHTVQRVSVQEGGEEKTAVIVGTPKSAYSTRTVPLTAAILHILRREKREAAGEYVVSCRGGMTEPRTLRYRYGRILRAAGIAPIHFHGLRHTFATRCVETGMDIAALSRILGHSSVKTTLDIYTGTTLEHKAASIQKLDDLDDAHPVAG